MEWRSRSVLSISAALLLVLTVNFLFQFNEPSQLFPAKDKISFEASRKNIWAELSESEAAEVNHFLLKELSHLNLVKHPKSAQENSIVAIETLRPNKTDAIAYLERIDGAIPQRWAVAILQQVFDDQFSYLVRYAVGPLPISEKSQVLPLDYPFNSGRNYVKSPFRDFMDTIEFGSMLSSNMSDITHKLLDLTTDSAALYSFPRPLRVSADRLILWYQFFRDESSSGERTVLPQGIYVKVDASGLDSRNWIVGECFYNGVLYRDVEAFRTAVSDPNFSRTSPNKGGSWVDGEDFDANPVGRELPPPVTIQPHGARYRLDRRQKFVSWFGFEFYITFGLFTGLTLYDIRFKGERVMYEIGLQEAMSHYAGDDPMAGGQEFLDSIFGMGKLMFELVPGYDCPAYADYLDTQFHEAQDTHTSFNSVCIFEYTADHLLSRHTAERSVTASRNTYLTVRSVSTIANYDYTIDYVFYMDGTLEVKVRASGYIYAAFYAANHSQSTEDEYGHRIRDALQSSMHDHVINFKADLDVAGPRNDLIRLAIEPQTKEYSWDLPEISKRNTMHLVEYPVLEETGLDWPANSGEFYIVYNAEAQNAWGERRGYRITPGTGMGTPPHLTIINSTTLQDSARWAEHDVWVLRRKDTEPRSSDPLNWLDPEDPIVNFRRMADGESLERGHDDDDDGYDGDLVLYFNLGAHHIPHSGDLPHTLMHTSASSVMFVPHNFHDRDPSRQNVQGVRMWLRDSGDKLDDKPDDLRARSPSSSSRPGPKVRYFGQPYEEGVQLSLKALEPDLTLYNSTSHDVSDLSFNGSAAGTWWPR